jgi:hypothetical protein
MPIGNRAECNGKIVSFLSPPNHHSLVTKLGFAWGWTSSMGTEICFLAQLRPVTSLEGNLHAFTAETSWKKLSFTFPD